MPSMGEHSLSTKNDNKYKKSLKSTKIRSFLNHSAFKIYGENILWHQHQYFITCQGCQKQPSCHHHGGNLFKSLEVYKLFIILKCFTAVGKLCFHYNKLTFIAFCQCYRNDVNLKLMECLDNKNAFNVFSTDLKGCLQGILCHIVFLTFWLILACQL